MNDTCPKCAAVFETGGGLDSHFADARHWEDADYPLFIQRRNVKAAADAATRAIERLRDEVNALEQMVTP